MSQGVPPQDLADEDLQRELSHLHEKADDIFTNGSDDQKANHRRRAAELEAEAARRWEQG